MLIDISKPRETGHRCVQTQSLLVIKNEARTLPIPAMTRNTVRENLSIGTDRSDQTVQTQIRLLLEEQSDQCLNCLPFCLHLLIARLRTMPKS